MYERYVPDIDGDRNDDLAMCFDVDLWDLKKNKIIGTATDCLSNVTGFGDGLALVATTYFDMGKKGTLITRGKTTVQPVEMVNHPIVTPTGQSITHITGASSDGNAIIGGTKKFKKATDTARLSGMVDLSGFTPGMVDSPITFDCIFIIDLD
jgi:hypothetical protein